jgi:hypothetical protein
MLGRTRRQILVDGSDWIIMFSKRERMAKKKLRKSGTPGERERITGRRRTKLPIILLTIITAFASLALIVAGVINFGASR